MRTKVLPLLGALDRLLIGGAVCLLASVAWGCAGSNVGAVPMVTTSQPVLVGGAPVGDAGTDQVAAAAVKVDQLAVVAKHSADVIWNDVRPWLLAGIAITGIMVMGAVIVLMYWIHGHSYLRQKPRYEAAKHCKPTAASGI